LLAVPVIVLLVLDAEDGSSTAATIIFATAALTDFLDGYLARATDTVTEFGRVFDPLVDRIFICGTVAALTLAGRLPWQGVAILIARDIFMILGYKILGTREINLRVTFLGKTYTALLMAAILMCLADIGPWLVLFWMGVAGSVITGFMYTVKGLAKMTEVNSASGPPS
ncbi:MAG: CDP-alcohol phosphatidyltransferase family protein, partial [Thermoleophilia bacterium]|nr:CDP-alcohol phosphatidyltransferase family protein [Thermoleophilia bacterium]